jgi:hypothetical protein
MKITNSIFTVLFVFLNLIAFAQDRDDAYFDSMAKEACDCSSVLLGYMDDINKLSEEGKVEEIYKLAELIEPESAKMEKCLAELEAKYSDIEANPTYEKRAEEALIRVCPAYARAMQMDDEYFKAAAIDICECTNGLFDKVSKMELLEAEGKTEELLKLADEVETDVAEMNKCMQILETKYSDIDGNPDYEKRAEDALRQYCPAFAMSLDNEKLAGEEEREEDNLIREEITEQKEEEIIEEEEIEEVVSEEDFYQQTMFDICDCIGSQKGLEEEYRKVAATKDGEKLMAFRMGLQQNYPGMFECLATMNDRVRKLDKDEDSRVKSKAAMIEHCPLFLDLMGLNKD